MRHRRPVELFARRAKFFLRAADVEIKIESRVARPGRRLACITSTIPPARGSGPTDAARVRAGIGRRFAERLHDQLGISTLEDLETARPPKSVTHSKDIDTAHQLLVGIRHRCARRLCPEGHVAVEPAHFNLILGWTSMVAGAISGATLGLFFHDERWMGGYASFRRRLMRLGHVAFFGLGILNVLFALSVTALSVPRPYDRVASAGFAVGAVTMPVCCFLTAWRGGFRYLFPIPVLAVLGGLGGLLGGWLLA